MATWLACNSLPTFIKNKGKKKVRPLAKVLSQTLQKGEVDKDLIIKNRYLLPYILLQPPCLETQSSFLHASVGNSDCTVFPLPVTKLLICNKKL